MRQKARAARVRSTGLSAEVMVFRYLARAKNMVGGPRRLVWCAPRYTSGSDVARAVRAQHPKFPPGRYRLEHRDANRWVVRVEVFEIDAHGAVLQQRGPRPRRRRAPAATPLPY